MTPKIATVEEVAAFYWAGIAYGILAPIDAIAWADSLIATGGEMATAIYDLSLTPPDQPKRLMSALRALHREEAVTDAVVRALLDVLRSEVQAKVRSPADAMQLAYDVTRRLSVDSPLWLDAMMLEENYSLAVDRIAFDVPSMDAEVTVWLSQFEGDATPFVGRAG
jgi:hypothetical protein